jgi:hypothetical protein
MRGERVIQVVFRGIEGKISNKQFIARVMFLCRLTVLSSDCSRTPGQKSSLN